jgi:hypothetical protein
MPNDNRKRMAVVMILTVLVAGCTAKRTELTRNHLEEAYRERPVSNILVIGVADKEETRRRFEERFVAALKSAGVGAFGSTDAVAIPPDRKLPKEAILEAVAGNGGDAVIITRLVDIQRKEAYSRLAPEAAGFYGQYGYLYNAVHDPGYSTERTTVWLETHLYDAASESLIWAADSKSINVESARQVIGDVIAAAVKDLLASGVVAPR